MVAWIPPTHHAPLPHANRDVTAAGGVRGRDVPTMPGRWRAGSPDKRARHSAPCRSELVSVVHTWPAGPLVRRRREPTPPPGAVLPASAPLCACPESSPLAPRPACRRLSRHRARLPANFPWPISRQHPTAGYSNTLLIGLRAETPLKWKSPSTSVFDRLALRFADRRHMVVRRATWAARHTAELAARPSATVLFQCWQLAFPARTPSACCCRGLGDYGRFGPERDEHSGALTSPMTTDSVVSACLPSDSARRADHILRLKHPHAAARAADGHRAAANPMISWTSSSPKP